MGFLQYEVADIAIDRWLIAVAVAAVAFVVLRVAKAIAVGRLAALAKKTTNDWDDIVVLALGNTKWFFYLALALYAAGVVYLQAEPLRNVLTTAVVLAFLVQCGVWGHTALAAWLDTYRKRKAEKDVAALTQLGPIRFTVTLVIWAAVLLMALDNLGVRIGPLIAGLGVGGIAVALAVQNILGDLFASLSIILDKPFAVGDFLIVDDLLGRVEKVGLKTTRVRSLWGEQLVFSNTDLLKSRLRNFGRMFERRVLFKLGVVYQTPRDKIQAIPGIIREAIEAHDKTRFDRSHFFQYGDFSLNFETVYYVLSPDYNVYMDIQQAINLRIHEVFEEQGIEFAYPTQTIFVATPKDASRTEYVRSDSS